MLQVLSGSILPIWSAIESAYTRYRSYNKSGFTVRIVRASISTIARKMKEEGAAEHVQVAEMKEEERGSSAVTPTVETIIGIWVPQRQVDEVRMCPCSCYNCEAHPRICTSGPGSDFKAQGSKGPTGRNHSVKLLKRKTMCTGVTIHSYAKLACIRQLYTIF